MKSNFILSALLVMTSFNPVFANNEVNVFLGQIAIDTYCIGTSPIKKIEIKVDSLSSLDLQHLQVEALYSIDSENGEEIVPLTIVPKGGISVDDISLCGAGSYRLSVVPQENCTLNLTTDFPDGTPQTKESIPLSPVATYHLDIVVDGDEE